MRRLPVVLPFGLMVACWASSALADSETCAKAYETAQSKRHDAKLMEARRDLVTCAQDACPSSVRKDCVAWLSEVEAEVPTIAVKVRVDGCDRPEALVSLDGAPVSNAAEGRPIEVDPGPHAIKATLGDMSQDQRIVVAAKEKHRVVTIAWGTKQLCAADGTSPPPGPSSMSGGQPRDASGETRKVPVLTYVLGGVGVVALGVSAGFGISAWNQKSDLDDCKGACRRRDVNDMERTYLVADVVGIVGVVSLAAATVLFLTR